MHGTAEDKQSGAKKTGKTYRRHTTDRPQTGRRRPYRQTADRPKGQNEEGKQRRTDREDRKGEDAAIDRRSGAATGARNAPKGASDAFSLSKTAYSYIRCVAGVLLPPRCILPRCGTWGPDNEWACRNPVPRRGARYGKSVYGTVYLDNIS